MKTLLKRSSLSPMHSSFLLLSGMLFLIIALSYGLIKVPKRCWEERRIDVITNYYYFSVKESVETRRDAFFEFETIYAVFTPY